jgi:hypothetical protein
MIIYANSDETGAPVLNNAAGSLDAILYAMLVTGWRVQTLTSLTVSGGVATGTLTGHGYSDMRVLEVSGATPVELNGQKLITLTGSATFTFPAPGVPDGPATGSIQVKRAACGWVRSHNSGTTSIYARTDLQATSMSLRVQDDASTPQYAKVQMVWGVADIATFTSQAPATGNLWWPKGADTAAAKKWAFVGDGRTAYLLLDGTSSYPASSYGNIPAGMFAFGDFAGDAPSGAFDCLISGSVAADGFASAMISESVLSDTPSGALAARSFSGIGAPVAVGMRGLRSGRIGGSGPLFPSPVDNGMRLHSPVLVAEANSTFNHPIRGAMRGLASPLANLPATQVNGMIIDVLGSPRKWLLAGVRETVSYGVAAFDLTGPW